MAQMSDAIKPAQLRIRVKQNGMETLTILSGETLQIATVASSILEAALQAIRDNGNQLSFPPTFEVKTGPRFALNEEKIPYGKRPSKK